MKQLTFILLICAICGEIYAQSTVKFSSITSEVQEIVGAPKTYFISVEVDKLPAVGNDFSVIVKDMGTGSASAADYQITSTTNLIFTSASPLVQIVPINLKSDSDVEPDETIDLSLSVSNNNATLAVGFDKETITIKDGNRLGPFIPPFLVSVGSNFDYLDQTVTLKSLNFGANAFLPEIFGKSQKLRKWGLTFGFNQNRSFTFQTDSSNRLDTNVPVGFTYSKFVTDRPVGKDSIWAVRNYGQVLKNSQIDNTSAYFGLTRLWNRGSNDDLKIYYQIRAEVLRRKITSDRVTNIISSDTLKIHSREFRTSPIASVKGEQQTSIDGYFGLGTYIVYRNDDFWIRGQAMLGYTGHSLSLLQGVSSGPKIYYYCEGSITETKLLGLTFGVEVRGFMPNYTPAVVVSLSKVFTLSKLTDFIKAPGK